MIIDNTEITETTAVSNAFNNYFCTVGPKLQNEIDNFDEKLFETYLPAPVKDSMFCSPVSDSEIFLIISKFKNNKSPGPDNIGPRLLKEIASDIISPFTHLINLSIATGKVPMLLKIAKVTPVYKKGDRCLVGNYRPISLLSVFDKILEKVMHNKLYSYLCKNHIVYN